MINPVEQKFLLTINLFWLGVLNLVAQYHISGPTTVNLGETKLYAVQDIYGSPPVFNYDPVYYTWNVSNGIFTSSSSNTFRVMKFLL